MNIITNREVYSYAGDEDPKIKKVKKEREPGKLKAKTDAFKETDLFKALGAGAGQYLTSKYGQSPITITNDGSGFGVGLPGGGTVQVEDDKSLEEKEKELAAKKKKNIITWSIVGGVVVIGIIVAVVLMRKKKISK